MTQDISEDNIPGEQLYNWLDRKVPDNFYLDAGKHTQDEIETLFDEIPDGYKPLALSIIELTNKMPGNTCLEFRSMLFLMYKDLLSNHNIDIKLPHYWYMDGVMVEPEHIVKVTNGIIGFQCDDSNKGCGRTSECLFYNMINGK